MRAGTLSVLIAVAALTALAQSAKPSYEDSLVLAPLYIEYTSVSAGKFAAEATELRRRIGEAPHVLLGFAGFLWLDYDRTPPLDRPVEETMLASTLRNVDTIVQRARDNALVTHIALVSGFFHGWNRLREVAIREDVRNAQWFADGWIAPSADLTNPEVVPRSVWATPSSYALPLRTRMEETVRLVSRHLAGKMAEFPETLVSVSGDGEVELTWERNFGPEATGDNSKGGIVYTDYSPFAVAEFRDWLRSPTYSGDRTPASDDDGDGHTFNKDFGQQFETWQLKYFEESGPISFAAYVELPDKLPTSGRYFINKGFDAPRAARAGNRFWDAWVRFRQQMIVNYVRNFARWMTTSPSISPDRFYSHQIPADFLFGQRDSVRLHTSASPVETAFINPFGSAGVTAYNLFDGKRHLRTATPALFSEISSQSANWGVLEYNPSAPARPTIVPSTDSRYYLEELRMLYKFRPHVIVPFPWTELPEHSPAAIKDRPFERALREFVQEFGKKPWSSRR
ncbi:MAG TPA: hypothetical protein VE422_06745 [Terriglobia bacterium]|nr:hypothetical protein [Terriglobia bacterium]